MLLALSPLCCLMHWDCYTSAVPGELPLLQDGICEAVFEEEDGPILAEP